MISFSSFVSFLFFILAFLFWLDTLITWFSWCSVSTRWFTVSKFLSYCWGLRTPYWQPKETVCPTIFHSPTLSGICLLRWQFWVRLTEMHSFTNFLNLFRECEKDTLYFRSLLAAVGFIKSAIFSKIFALAANFWFLKIIIFLHNSVRPYNINHMINHCIWPNTFFLTGFSYLS